MIMIVCVADKYTFIVDNFNNVIKAVLQPTILSKNHGKIYCKCTSFYLQL